MAEKAWPEISPSTLADQVYQAVRDRILEGEIAPGEFAREQDLSSAMKVSRTPLREALTRLASEGLLERLPHRGFRVPEVSHAQLMEIYPIVSALEVLAGTLAFPTMGPNDVARLKEINGELEGALERNDVTAQIALNFSFHRAISEQSGNDRLAQILDDLRSQLDRLEQWYYSYPANSRRSILEHGRIIAALEAGDLSKATEILRDNMSLTKVALFDQTGLGEERGAAKVLVETGSK